MLIKLDPRLRGDDDGRVLQSLLYPCRSTRRSNCRRDCDTLCHRRTRSCHDRDLLLEFTAVPAGGANTIAQHGDRAQGTTIMPNDLFSTLRPCRFDLRRLVFALLLLVQVVQKLQGNRCKRQPLVGILVRTVPAIPAVPTTTRLHDGDGARVTDAVWPNA